MAEIRKCGTAVLFAIAACMLAAGGDAQSLIDQVNFKSVSVGGLRLYGVSVFSGYSTTAFPIGLGQAAPAGLQDLGGSINFGASASVGWQFRREKTNLSALYSGSYTGVARYTDANAFNHSFSMNASRQLSRKWTLTLAGAAQDTTLAELMQQPSGLSVISQLPSSFTDLAAAFSVGQYSDAQIASALTGAAMTASPGQGLLLGNRILSYSGSAGLTYAHSSRMSFHFASFTAGGESRRGGQNGIPEDKFVLPSSLGMSAGMGLSYALSPRTQVGLNMEESRVKNGYQNAYSTNATASFGRKMGLRWFLSMHAGGSMTRTVAQTYGEPVPRQVIGGGSLGYRAFAQTIVASYDRSSSDAFGFAVGTNTTASASWTWQRPGTRWSVFASGAQYQMRNSGFASISGWQAAAGLSAKLSAQTGVSAQYVYMHSQGSYVGSLNNLVAHSVRLSISWNPQTPPTPVVR